MASVVSNLVSTLGVTEVEKVVISEEASAGDGTFVRSIKVYGAPKGADGDPILTIQLSATNSSKLLIEVPKTLF